MNNIEGIRQLIAQERLDEALRALAELLPLHLQNDLILLKSRLTSLERDSRLYLIDINDARMERHRITTAALMLVKILGGNDVIHHSEEYILPISGTSSSLDSSTLSQQKGVIMHKIPRRMQINNLHRCIIRIAFDKDTILKNLPIYAKNGKFQPVRVSEKMEVSFKENEYFKIKAINAASQLIEEDEATEWNFDVTPLRLGRFPIDFIVKVVLPNGQKEAVLTESIKVISKPAKSTMTFVVSDLEAVRDSKIKISQIHTGSGDNIAGNKIINESSQIEVTEYSKKIPKSILFAAASPSDEARIETDLEHRTIKEEMQKGTHRDQFTFLPSQLAVRITELMRSFKNKPSIIHFAGHGAEEGIIVSNDQNQAQLLSDLTIQRLFKPLKGKTELVLLNSCYSAFQAELISKIGMIVIGHNLPIGDAAAVGFSKGFYLGLSEGMTYEDAFNDGVTSVLAENDAYASGIEVWQNGVKLDW